MEVNVIGDEQDNTVPKEAIALGRDDRMITWAGLALGSSVGSSGLLLPSQVHRPPESSKQRFLTEAPSSPLPGSAPYQQCQHLEHGDLCIAQVGKEINEGRDAQPVSEAGANGCAHQGAFPLWAKAVLRTMTL